MRGRGRADQDRCILDRGSVGHGVDDTSHIMFEWRLGWSFPVVEGLAWGSLIVKSVAYFSFFLSWIQRAE